jgi:TetR/AcrR family transcriptional regulator, transcriptional repressor for nem operon
LSKQGIYHLKLLDANTLEFAMKHFSEITSSAERVVDAAEGLVQRFGYNGFSYDDIAQKIGIKKPSIHHHFATKSELVATVAQRYTHRFLEQLDLIESTHADAPARLDAYVMLFEQTYAQDRQLCVCGMLGSEANDLPKNVANEVQEFFSRNLAWLAHVITAGYQGKKAIHRDEAHTRAMTFLCTLEGAMMVGRGLRSNLGPRTAIGSLVSYLLV